MTITQFYRSRDDIWPNFKSVKLQVLKKNVKYSLLAACIWCCICTCVTLVFNSNPKTVEVLIFRSVFFFFLLLPRQFVKMWTAIALSHWRLRIQPDKKQARLCLSIWVGWWQVPDRYLLARILPYLALLLTNLKCNWMFSRGPQLVSRIELNLCSDFCFEKERK